MSRTSKTWRKAILWMSGLLIWVFALSVGLAWYQFGYLDLRTVASMGLILIPLLVVAVGVLVWVDLKEPVELDESERERSRKTAETLGDNE